MKRGVNAKRISLISIGGFNDLDTCYPSAENTSRSIYNCSIQNHQGPLKNCAEAWVDRHRVVCERLRVQGFRKRRPPFVLLFEGA